MLTVSWIYEITHRESPGTIFGLRASVQTPCEHDDWILVMEPKHGRINRPKRTTILVCTVGQELQEYEMKDVNE